jgi:hypothetical protein
MSRSLSVYADDTSVERLEAMELGKYCRPEHIRALGDAVVELTEMADAGASIGTTTANQIQEFRKKLSKSVVSLKANSDSIEASDVLCRTFLNMANFNLSLADNQKKDANGVLRLDIIAHPYCSRGGRRFEAGMAKRCSATLCCM